MIQTKTDRTIGFNILKFLALIPILGWPYVFYGSMLYINDNLDYDPLGKTLFVLIISYPIFIILTVVIADKLYAKHKKISFGLLSFLVLGSLITLTFLFY